MIAQDNNPFGSRILSPKMKALLNNYTQAEKAKSAVTKQPSYTAEKKDSFLEGFNDPYGEKNAFPRQSLAQRMMAQFANPAQQTPQSPMIKTETPKYALPNIGNSNNNYSEKKVEAPKTELRASPAANTSEDDAFREGFNYYNDKELMFPNTELRAKPKNYGMMFPNTQLHAGSSIKASERDAFLEGLGFSTDKELMFPNTELHAKPKNYGMMFPNTQLHASPSKNKSEDDAFKEGFNDPYGEKKVEAKDSKKSVSESISDWGENIGAHIGLHNTAHEQYPWMRYAGLLSPAAIEGRITTSSAKVSKHKDTINEVANRYNVPKELIGGIIFKEQLTKSLPDTLANIDKSIREDEKHSTGLGAIRAETARDAWKWVDDKKELPKTNADLQWKLTYDKKFNIETIAVVLRYEAERNKIISDISEASNLTTDQWWEAVKKYNGSGEYARKVYEYLPFATELLD